MFSQFLRGDPKSVNSVVDTEMEGRFARQKYAQFRAAFMIGALIMAIGMAVLAMNAALKDKLSRVVILTAGVLPIYVLIGLWVFKRKMQYLSASGTFTERVLTGLLAVQSSLIVLGEWLRGESMDYGALVMHIGFIFNFSPLSFGAMMSVTTVFGMLPYTLLVMWYAWSGSTVGNMDCNWGCHISSGNSQSNPVLDAQYRIYVPTFILTLQVIVTKRRDEVLRVDTLVKENLRTQKRLLDGERRRNEGLLRSMLPWKVIEALKVNEPIKPQRFDDVTVVFIEICDFNLLCHELQPNDVMEVLNVLYHEFDRLSDILKVYKVETVMQVYMAVVGCPEPNVKHADIAAYFAFAVQRSMGTLRHRIDRNVRGRAMKSAVGGGGDTVDLSVRVGLNSGPVRAGIVGMDSPRYKLVGDTVNTASRMESTCEPGKIQVSPSTIQRLSNGQFELEERGEISVKGKGKMRTSYLVGYGGNGCPDRLQVLMEQPHRRHSIEALASPTNSERVSSHVDVWAEVRYEMDRRTSRSFSACSSLTDLEMGHCSSERGDVEATGAVAFGEEAVSAQPSSSLVTNSFVSAREAGNPQQAATSPGSSSGISTGTHEHLPKSAAMMQLAVKGELGRMPTVEAIDEDAMEHNTSLNSKPSQSNSGGKIKTLDSLASSRLMQAVDQKLNTVLQSRGSETVTVATSLSNGRKAIETTLVQMVGAALGREATQFAQTTQGINGVSSNEVAVMRSTAYSRAVLSKERAMKCWERVNLLFLLVPPTQKSSSWIQELVRDRPEFLAQVMPRRISLARKITTFVLLVATISAVFDHMPDARVLDVGGTQLKALYRTNTLGTSAGFVYLLFLGSDLSLSPRYLQTMTIVFLTVENGLMMVTTIGIYKNETMILASTVSFCAVVFFYTVLTIWQRLMINTIAVAVYVVARTVAGSIQIKSTAILDSLGNIGFLVVFVAFMTVGVRLQEHLAHVSHYEQRHAQLRLDRIKQAKVAGSHLLNTLLPRHVINLVCDGVSPIAEYHSDITVIFTDIKGFTDFSSRISPYELFTVLNSMFSAFDEIILNWGLHKVEVIGDAYFISAGCPAPAEETISPSEYAMRAVEVSLALQRSLPSVCDDPNVKMRIGLHTGPVVAGVVGKKGPRYHLFGTTVAYAEKMESNGIAGRVQISDDTHNMLVSRGHSYEFEERLLSIEGEDRLQRAWLVGKSMSKEAVQIQMQLAQRRHKAMTQGNVQSFDDDNG